MEKKFRVLRIIGTLWKVLAWIALIGGILSSLGILAAGVLGSGSFVLRMFEQRTGVMPGALGLVSSVLGFILMLVGTIFYFLILYAAGELIYLLLAIEENTRQTVRLMQHDAHVGTQQPPSAPSAPTDIASAREE